RSSFRSGTVVNSDEPIPVPSEFGLTCPRTYHKLILFVRHGQYNLKGRTPDEKRLTEIGWKQAYEAGRQLKRLGIKIDRIVHSDLIRARQTTAAVLVGLQDDFDPLFDTSLLTNLSSGAQPHLLGNYARPSVIQYEGLTPEDRSSSDYAHPPMLGEPYRPYPGASFDCQESRFLTEGPPPVSPEPPNRNSTSQVVRQTEGLRLERGFRTHIHRLPVTTQGRAAYENLNAQARLSSSCRCSYPYDCRHVTDDYEPCETVVFVGHANVFRFWLCRALQLPPEAWLRFSLYHGSISSILISWTSPLTSGHKNDSVCTVTALRIGEIGHFPTHLLTR
ncbi:hypothetical protein P879_01391, partial [Paragonimus westermani]